MNVLSPATEALMKAVISAPPTDLACTVCCKVNHCFAIHIEVQSVHLMEERITRSPAFCCSVALGCQ